MKNMNKWTITILNDVFQLIHKIIRVLIPFGSFNRFLWQKRTVQISEQKFGLTFSEELKYSKV